MTLGSFVHGALAEQRSKISISCSVQSAAQRDKQRSSQAPGRMPPIVVGSEPDGAARSTVGAKLDVRAFAGSAVDRLSPLPLPKRLTGARY